MNVVSLFSGCGGLDLGFSKAGFNIIWANEFDNTIHETYSLNNPQTFLEKRDIRNISSNIIPDCDGIIGGPPCQSWSEGGKGLGIYDDRGRVFLEFIRVVKDKRPRFFLIENVKGMLNYKHKDCFLFFIKSLTALNYKVQYTILNAVNYKIPQDRERLFIIGIRSDINKNFTYPEKINNISINLFQAIGDITEQPQSCSSSINISDDNIFLKNHEYYNGVFDDVYMSRNRVRSWNEPSFTIQAQAKNIPIHPQAPKMIYVSNNKRIFIPEKTNLYRRLSVRECARIQTFSDKFIFKYNDIKDGYKMIGNAVPPRLAYFFALKIKSVFV